MMDGPSIMTRRPGSPQKSNLELTNSLRNNFRAAQQDYSPLQSGTPAEGPNGGTSTNGKLHRRETGSHQPSLQHKCYDKKGFHMPVPDGMYQLNLGNF